MALPRAPEGTRTTSSSFHHYDIVWCCLGAHNWINSPQLLLFLSFLWYLTVICPLIFSFSRIKNFASQRQYLAEQEGPFQCDLKPVGITFCPTEYESENLTKHEEAVLSTHRLTHCWFINSPVFAFLSSVLNAWQANKQLKERKAFLPFYDKE